MRRGTVNESTRFSFSGLARAFVKLLTEVLQRGCLVVNGDWRHQQGLRSDHHSFSFTVSGARLKSLFLPD